MTDYDEILEDMDEYEREEFLRWAFAENARARLSRAAFFLWGIAAGFFLAAPALVIIRLISGQ